MSDKFPMITAAEHRQRMTPAERQHEDDRQKIAAIFILHAHAKAGTDAVPVIIKRANELDDRTLMLAAQLAEILYGMLTEVQVGRATAKASA